MKNQVGMLIAATLALWTAAFPPARYFQGVSAAVHSLVAMGLCLLPATLTLLWASLQEEFSPQRQIMLVFWGMGLRMAAVLGGGLVLSAALPYFRETAFWLWLLLFYLFTLTLEIILLRGGHPAGSSP